MKFTLHSTYKPAGDQPQAIAQLTEGILSGEHYQTLLGVTGSGKNFHYCQCNSAGAAPNAGAYAQ